MYGSAATANRASTMKTTTAVAELTRTGSRMAAWSAAKNAAARSDTARSPMRVVAALTTMKIAAPIENQRPIRPSERPLSES